jgi:protein-glutamine gamma-glutamyltransferase
VIEIKEGNFDYSDFAQRYVRSNAEKNILDIMWASREKYSYESYDELTFEIMLRGETVSASVALHQSGMEFKVFRESRCNPAYWEKTPEGGFLMKRNVSASSAIRDIFENGAKYATECATAMIIVYYKALLGVYPEELYNRLFKRIQLMNWHYVHDLLSEAGYMRTAKDYMPGDRRYVINPDVNPLTPECRGENLIDLGNGRYYGHGIGTGSVEYVIRELNECRREGATRSAYLLDTVGLLNFKLLHLIKRQGQL